MLCYNQTAVIIGTLFFVRGRHQNKNLIIAYRFAYILHYTEYDDNPSNTDRLRAKSFFVFLLKNYDFGVLYIPYLLLVVRKIVDHNITAEQCTASVCLSVYVHFSCFNSLNIFP